MDAIEALDWGVYSHFRYQAAQHEWWLDIMEPAYYISSYVGVALAMLLIVALCFALGKPRVAMVSLWSFVAAGVLIVAVRNLVPRRRPEDAATWFDREKVLSAWLGKEEMTGSYPSAAVLLILLGILLLGSAMWSRLGMWTRSLYVVMATGLVVWICLSQFFLATHFLTDVIGGIMGAILIAMIASRFLKEPRTN